MGVINFNSILEGFHNLMYKSQRALGQLEFSVFDQWIYTSKSIIHGLIIDTHINDQLTVDLIAHLVENCGIGIAEFGVRFPVQKTGPRRLEFLATYCLQSIRKHAPRSAKKLLLICIICSSDT